MAGETAFLMPSKKGGLVRDPKTRVHLPQTGALKPMIGTMGKYWRSRLREGSVVIGAPPAKQSPVIPKEEEKVEKRKHGKRKEE